MANLTKKVNALAHIHVQLARQYTCPLDYRVFLCAHANKAAAAFSYFKNDHSGIQNKQFSSRLLVRAR